MSTDLEFWATTFHHATERREEAPRPTELWPGCGLDDAYAIQTATVNRRIARGESIRAIKLGLTQQAEQDQWSIPHPTFGTLTNDMLLGPGDIFEVSLGVEPKVEAEIVVVLSRAISRYIHSLDDLVSSVGSVHAGIEILDSRFRQGGFQPLDAVADNQSALSGVWAHDGMAVADIDIVAESATLTINGEVKGSGLASKILGNPLTAVLGAVNERVRLGLDVPAGLAIFSGNLCEAAVPVASGDQVTVTFSSLGSLSLDVGP